MINHQLQCHFCTCVGLEVKLVNLTEVVTCPACYRLLAKKQFIRIPKKKK